MTLCNLPAHSQNQHTVNPHPLSSQQSQQSQQQQSLPPQNLHPSSIHSQHASFRGVPSSNNIPSHLIQHPQRGYTQASHHPQSHPQQNLMNIMTASSELNSTYGCVGRPSPLMLQAPQSIHGLSSSHLSSQSNLPLPISKSSSSPGHSKYQQVGRPPFPLTTNISLPPGLSPSQYGLNLNHFNPSMPSAPLLSSQSSYGRIPPAITTSNNSPHSTSRSNINNSSNNRTLITKVHKNDVLSGRGVNIAHHFGNERFRSLITTYLDNNYCTSYSASEKRAIALEIITHIQALNPVGRFLRRDGRGQVSRGLLGPWEQLTQREAIKKTCQALRDCNRTDRSGYANGIDEPIDVIENKKRVKELGVSVKNLAEMAVVKNANASKQNNTVSVPASLKVPGCDGPRNTSPGGTATENNSTKTSEDRARGNNNCINHHHPHHRDAIFGINSRNTMLNIPTNNSGLLQYAHAPLDPHAAHADQSRYTIASSSSSTLQQPVNPFQNMVPSLIPPHPSHASQPHSHHHGVGNYHHHHPRSLLHPPSGAVIPGAVLGQSQRSNNLNIHAPASSNNGTYRYHQRGGGSVSGNVGHNNSNNANNNNNQNDEIYTSTSGNKTTDDTEPLSSSSASAPNEEHAHEHNTHREHYNHEHHDEPTSPHRTVLLAVNVEGIRGNNEKGNNKNRNENEDEDEDDAQDNLSIRSHMSNSDKMLLSSPHHHHSPHLPSLHQNHSPSSFEVGNEQNDGKDNDEDDVNLNVNINDDDDDEDEDEEEGHNINKTIEDDIAIDNWTNGPQHDTNEDNHGSSNISSQSLSSSPVTTDDVMEADHHDFNVEVDELSNDDNDDVVDHHDVKFEQI